LCSGWVINGSSRVRGCDRGFVLSDHADWPALVETCLETGARRVLLMHGSIDALASHLTERGVEARALEERPAAEDRTGYALSASR
jgi:putative mRNA 3-end processing factor